MGICIGVDVAKAHLDWVLGPKGKVERITNTKVAVRKLVRKLHELEFDRVVLESTGQYERLLFEALGDEGIPVVRMNPLRVRRFGEGKTAASATAAGASTEGERRREPRFT